MELSAAIELFTEHRILQGVRAQTLDVHQMWFKLWFAWRDDHHCSPNIADISIVELRQFSLYLRSEYQTRSGKALSDYSLLSAWRSLRALWTFLAEEKLLTSEQISFFPRRLPAPRIEENVRPTYSANLWELMLTACNSPVAEQAARDKAILLLLAESGMRASELCGMQLSDLDTTNRQCKIRGKGRKERFVFWGPLAADALAEYLKFRTQLATSHQALFCLLRKPQPLNYNALRLLFRRLANRAGVKLPAGASIHALRHTFARQALNAGVDGLHLQQLLGHSDLRTTTRYVRENPEPLRAAHAKIFS